MCGAGTGVEALLMPWYPGGLSSLSPRPRPRNPNLHHSPKGSETRRLELRSQRSSGRALVWHRAQQGHTQPVQRNE